MANKRVSVSERMKKPVTDSLFNAIDNNEEETSKHENKETSKHTDSEVILKDKDEKYTRQTYYLTKDLIDALAVYSTFEKLDKSEIVRNALNNYIPEKYKEMAKEMAK